MIILYFIIAICATTVGAATGMGGGVIIKPILDVMGGFDSKTIGVLSSVTVLAMAVVSVGKHVYAKSKVDFKTAVPLAIGSSIGGYAGNAALDRIAAGFENYQVKIIQNGVLAALIILVLLYMLNKQKIKGLALRGYAAVAAVGLLLGIFSSFLGIGGGPINVALIIFTLSLDTKSAAICSLVTILFAQISKLGVIAFTEGFAQYDLSALPFMVLGAVLGGFIGAQISSRLPEKRVEVLFNATQVLVFGICIYNIAANWAG